MLSDMTATAGKVQICGACLLKLTFCTPPISRWNHKATTHLTLPPVCYTLSSSDSHHRMSFGPTSSHFHCCMFAWACAFKVAHRRCTLALLHVCLGMCFQGGAQKMHTHIGKVLFLTELLYIGPYFPPPTPCRPRIPSASPWASAHATCGNIASPPAGASAQTSHSSWDFCTKVGPQSLK